MAHYQILRWREIPVQVKLRGAGRGERLSRGLPERFQQAIDRAAMHAGMSGSDDYLAELVTGEWIEREGGLEAVALEVVQELERDYPQARLEALVREGGRAVTTET
jgi:hypothetical protein